MSKHAMTASHLFFPRYIGKPMERSTVMRNLNKYRRDIPQFVHYWFIWELIVEDNNQREGPSERYQ